MIASSPLAPQFLANVDYGTLLRAVERTTHHLRVRNGTPAPGDDLEDEFSTALRWFLRACANPVETIPLAVLMLFTQRLPRAGLLHVISSAQHGETAM
jgi:hypothetical protein